MRHERRASTQIALCAIMIFAFIRPVHAQVAPSPTLEAVKARGALRCGISGTIPGFALPDRTGDMRGMDADSCRAIAAAVLGDSGKVQFVLTTTVTRFTALQSGETDVLLRDTGWSLTREGRLGLEFASVNFGTVPH